MPREAPQIPFKIDNVRSPKGQRRMLFEYARQALGKDIENYACKSGDTVGFVAKNVLEYTQAVQIALGERDDLVPIYPPYLYYTARNKAGGGTLSGEGACADWMDIALRKYGALAADHDGVPPYDGAVSKKWGNGNVPAEFQEPDVYLIGSGATVDSVVDIMVALDNGYVPSIYGMQAFNMLPDADGFHKPNHQRWPHGFAVIGFDDGTTDHELYFILLNHWGDVHGDLKDFKTGKSLPPGCLRVRAEALETMVEASVKRQNELFVYSPYDRFANRAERLDAALKSE